MELLAMVGWRCPLKYHLNRDYFIFCSRQYCDDRIISLAVHQRSTQQRIIINQHTLCVVSHLATGTLSYETMNHSKIKGTSSSRSSNSARGGTASSSPKMTPHSLARVSCKTVLRVRPLLKKERDDPIALEPMDSGTAVALHPPVVAKEALPVTGLSNTSNGATDTTCSTVVMAGEDLELPFDRVLAASANQEKVYAVVGQPMALAVMESLKNSQRQREQQQHGATTNHHSHNRTIRSTTAAHVIVGLGLAQSGTTYTCLAGSGSSSSCGGTTRSTISSKRKLETDGLVPRILDSLYSQSKHSFSQSSSTTKKACFAVEITMLQVNQSKTNPSDCHLYDLLSPVPKSGASGATTTPSAVVEQLGSNINHLAASLLHSIDHLSAPHKTHRASGGKGPHNTSSSSSSYAAMPHEAVRVQQDPVTSECRVVNAQSRTCTTPEEARACLQSALTHSQQLSHKKYQSHVWVQLQPLLQSKSSGRRLATGNVVAVLDMASCWDGASSLLSSRSARSREPNRAETAHAAVMHCLRALFHNQQQANSSSSSSSSRQDHAQPSLRKVPFLQHSVTMLLQPLFATTSMVHLTLLVTASPSHRDYVEKKLFLTEMVQLHACKSSLSSKNAVRHPEQHQSQQQQQQQPPHSDDKRHSKKSSRIESDADDEASQDGKHRHGKTDSNIGVSKNKSEVPAMNDEAGYDSGLLWRDQSQRTMSVARPMERKHSMSYSESTADGDCEDDYDENESPHRPPPVAPGYKDRLTALASPPASAPVEESRAASVAAPPPILTVDFPGVVMPMPSTRSALTDVTPVSPRTKRFDPTCMSADGNNECVPIAVAEEAADEQPKFSYMKTINKVVHASKKKGRKVMERMTVTTIGSSDHHQLQQRIAELELQNAALMREKAALAQQNQQLLEQLHGTTSHRHAVSSDAATPESPSEDQSAVETPKSSAYSIESSHLEVVESSVLHSSSGSLGRPSNSPRKATVLCDNQNSPASARRFSVESSSCAPDQLYDNPMFQHMASMNNNGQWKTSKSQRRVTHRYEKTYDEDAFSEDSNDENVPAGQDAVSKTMFDDPLLQHMAMMNY
jgi:hypothetical protein